MQPSEPWNSVWPAEPVATRAPRTEASPREGDWARVLVLRDGRPTAQASLRAVVIAALVALLAVPAGAGVALRLSLGPRVQPLALVLGEQLSNLGSATGRAVPFLVMPASVPPVAPPPPPVPEVQLPGEPATPESRRGHLRVYALHLEETLDVVPFDAEGRPVPEAFAEIEHLWRCRITGHEVRVHPQLVRTLVAINDLYDRPLQLISGHRVPHTIGTSPTSQHTLGNAADVRVAGVPTRELRALAKKLGGRGVGLYAEQRFVHVDYRPGRRYFWSDVDETEHEDRAHFARQSARGDDTGRMASAPDARAQQSLL